MISKTTQDFWEYYAGLPANIKERAKKAYSQFLKDPYYPSLHFKRIHSTQPIFSVRITKDYRAIGTLKENYIIWFWIGSYSDYDRLVSQLRSPKI